MIKKIFKGSKEVKIARYLSDTTFRENPQNHCVPILDIFSEEDDSLEFIVMPLLMGFTRPPFAFVDEAIDFMKQTLEV